MYNYYTFNKEQLASQKELKRKEKEAFEKDKYKLQQERMINNHQTRVKRFVLELVKNPLIIQDVTIHDNYLYKSLNGMKTGKSIYIFSISKNNKRRKTGNSVFLC